MKPVLVTPTASGVLPTGGIATATPMPKTFAKVGLRWCLSMMMRPRGLTSLSSPITAGTPRKAGSIIANANGSSWLALVAPLSSTSSTNILSLSTLLTLALVIHLM